MKGITEKKKIEYKQKKLLNLFWRSGFNNFSILDFFIFCI